MSTVNNKFNEYAIILQNEIERSRILSSNSQYNYPPEDPYPPHQDPYNVAPAHGYSQPKLKRQNEYIDYGINRRANEGIY
jgi:hypothetical protein